MAKLDLPKIEKKWQKRWEKAKLYYGVKEKINGKKNFYHLVMLPYTSGDLHIGHWYNFGPSDTYARFKRMQGFNVLSPMGFDAFGLPAENAAIKRNISPANWTMQNIENMRKQLKSMGPMYDWSREVITCKPDYYTWTQWMFLQMFKAGLAEKRKTWANWCPSDKTVLANEQVVEGKCERCGSEVVQREIDQWVFKITKYAQRLLDDLDNVDWPERTKTAQRNWIGRSDGILITYPIEGINKQITVFTTRPDTNFGATFLVLAPEHDLAATLATREYKAKVDSYITATRKRTELERMAQGKKKTGVFTGRYAINHLTGKKMPIWIGDFVLASFGTGAVVGVPGHDVRDFEFAKEFGLEILRVVIGKDGDTSSITQARQVQEEEGKMINSGFLDGMDIHSATKVIMDYMEQKGYGKKIKQYRLRDWIVSRQRYWGAPIPMVECKKCGLVAIPEKELPVVLPELKNFRPADDGRSPLAKVVEFVNTACPQCKGTATRETDTMDTFVDSSWYYLRYTDPHNDKEFAGAKKMQAWLPVDIYIGGAEHTVLHLLYSRFFTKVLYDLKYIDFTEPFTKLRHQGTILGTDSQKMSKSRGNVIAPDPLVKQYGADVVRMFLGFLGPYDQGGQWSPGAINGVARFAEKVYRLITKSNSAKLKIDKRKRLLHRTIKKVGEDLEQLHFNTAISALMIFVNKLQEENADKKTYETLVKLLAPFAPHLAQELWAKLGHKTSVHNETFPTFDPALIQEEAAIIIVQVNGKLRGKLITQPGLSQEEVVALAKQDGKINEWLSHGIKKTIFVPNKLINFVTI